VLEEGYVRCVRLTLHGYAVVLLICDEQLLLASENDVVLAKVVGGFVPEVECEVVLWMYFAYTLAERTLVDDLPELHLRWHLLDENICPCHGRWFYDNGTIAQCCADMI
jgi:hypothetical protein